MSLEPHRWAVVSTIKAPTKDILNFAAYYLHLGATHLYLFLDFPDPDAQENLEQHPNIRVTNTGPDYWQARSRRPQTVERRQIENIKTAIEFARGDHISWLGHFDHDEFLHVPSHANVGMRLARLDGDVMCARALPVEYLAPDDPNYKGPDQFKRLAAPFARRRQISMWAYPEFGAKVSGGFLSHQVGKSFFRIVPELMAPRIHFCDYPTHSDTKIKTLAHLDLAHYHTDAWDKFYQKYQQRRASGSYRKVISGGKTYETERKSLHDILEDLEQNEGVAGLKRLHRELCLATPELVARLDQYDLYRLYDFNFDAKRAQYFPQFSI